ncbi:Fip1-domain-containing protein [Suhomyces tanzawaensis NRRL Y-17324]|uniref:Pre-mRNA polyadenylation factor FIP1 n=1 Tax=Suhomyces tanzawaensis NRRL Y-17324 TaxID=984487 RepID=A0A1E4SGN9_9ASCO|nr:Fip1-domain-containing protein [Suhomyces tanzawaensis NRRL Y-17324]ODV78674.1 Fip1-domain-containing protein [Suhomyces tanzawaensis NRRL Y-17324]
MAKHEDDEDAYLYGSDDEEDVEQSRKRQKVESSTNSTEETNEEKAPVLEEAVNDEEDDDEDEEEDSDDDIDIIIGDTASAPSTGTVTTSGPQNDTVDATVDPDAEEKVPTTTIVNKDQNENKTTIDVHAVAEYEGKPITQVDLEVIKEKPWRAPGADISDYFNYGFDEFTWTAYCCKHDKLRGEFNPQKLMAQIMAASGAGGPGNGPPGFPPMGMLPPGMPPMGMMPGMPNMPNMPKMQGMPKMPNMPNMPPMPNMPNFPDMQNFPGNKRQGHK